MTLLPVYLLVFLVWVNRYFLGAYLRWVRGAGFDRTVDDYEPTVTVVTPMYNEGPRVARTVESLLALDYPEEKIELVMVDDASTDGSGAHALAAGGGRRNFRVLRNPENLGKRLSINRAVRESRSEIIVSVDSDVEVDPGALRELLRRFTSPRIAAVGGRVNVANANENWLTKMQAIKYFFSYEYLKNLEKTFHSVMCLSGCLSAFRREVLVQLEPVLENRRIFGVPIKYGEDRFLTRQIIKAGWETFTTLDAVCWTQAPPTLDKYFSQQLRWRRSNLVDFFGGLSHAWKLPPLVAVHYLSLFGMLISYPFVVYYNLTQDTFWDLAAFNLTILAFFGAVYGFGVRRYPAALRVHPLWFLAMAVVMPVTYLLCTPLALFTLDSGSWETREVGTA